MIPYILVMILLTENGLLGGTMSKVTTIEFQSQVVCEEAKRNILRNWASFSSELSITCVAKTHK